MHFVSASVTVVPTWMFIPGERVAHSRPLRWEFVCEGMCRGFSVTRRKAGLLRQCAEKQAPSHIAAAEGDLGFSAKTE